MDIAKARTAYFQHKGNAKRRGIEWCFTFETWVAWWGDDIERRGVGRDNLQMQRIADTGPYHPENVRKGTPQQNSDTYSRMYKHRESRAARAAILAAEMEKPAISAEAEDTATGENEYPSRRFTRWVGRGVYGW